MADGPKTCSRFWLQAGGKEPPLAPPLWRGSDSKIRTDRSFPSSS